MKSAITTTRLPARAAAPALAPARGFAPAAEEARPAAPRPGHDFASVRVHGPDIGPPVGSGAVQMVGEPPDGKAHAKRLNARRKVKGMEWRTIGANQTLKLVNTLAASAASKKGPKAPKAKSKLEGMYRGSPYLHKPRSFRKERAAQAQRWISTSLLASLAQKGADPREVQTTLAKGRLYASSNTNSANRALGGTFGPKTPLAEGLRTVVKGLDPTKLSAREKRHVAKLRSRLLGKAPRKGYEAVGRVLGKPLGVPAAVAGSREGLHAERRLKEQLGHAFNIAVTRGVKRPCAVCRHKLGGKGHTGALWPSKASTLDFDMSSNKDLDAIADTPTDATLTRDGAVTFDHDTDSDSDADT